MYSSIGKPFTFLLLCGLLAIFSSAVAAQNKFSNRILTTEMSAESLEIEPNLKIDLSSPESDSFRIAGSDNVFEKSQTVYNFKKQFENVEEPAIESPQFDAVRKTEINEFAYRFRRSVAPEKLSDFSETLNFEEKEFSFRTGAADDTKNNKTPDKTKDLTTQGFQWRSAINQSLMFLAIQHGYAFTQPKTREALKGKFFKDYASSVKSLHGWNDGGRFFTNYIAHPMQGSLTGFIYVQNDPKAIKQQFGTSKDYWTSRLKAMAWSAAWSTQFEIGPISQASIGNVGLTGKQTWIDIVITPTVGTAMLISEDAVDRLIMKRIERSTNNFYVKIFSRMLLSPTRNFSNMFRFKPPWHRDRPVAR